MNFENTNNYVYLQGIVENEPVFDHTVKLGREQNTSAIEEDFYTFNLIVSRLSEERDIIPIIISGKYLNEIVAGKKIAMRGQFRSYNENVNGKSRLNLFMFCREICEWDDSLNSNYIELHGYLCKPPIYRTTPLNREICDIHLAVNRNYSKSDYIPCIAWGGNAKFASGLKVGDQIELVGRIQSRVYKKLIDGVEQTKYAREVSISELAIVQKENVKRESAI